MGNALGIGLAMCFGHHGQSGIVAPSGALTAALSGQSALVGALGGPGALAASLAGAGGLSLPAWNGPLASGMTGSSVASGTFNAFIHNLVSSVPVISAHYADVGVTHSGGTVSAWADQSGNGYHYAEATNKPAYNATGLDGLPIITGDGSNDLLTQSGIALPAPGTTPTFYWIVASQISWTANDPLIGGSDGTLAIRGRTATPTLGQTNPTNVNLNNGAALGTWVLIESLFNNSTGGFLRCGATNVTGGNAGNSAPAAGRTLFANAGAFGNFAVAAVLKFAGEPTERAAMRTACTAKWPSVTV